MDLSSESEKVECLAQEIALTAPEGWSRIVFYQELLAQADGAFRNKSTARCWIDNDQNEYERSFEIGGSMEAFEAVEDFYKIAKNKGEEWSGLLLNLTSNGKFSIKLYYEDTPLINGDSNLVKVRMGC